MPKISRFKRRNSDRSGFKFYEIELIKDGPYKVQGDEFDQPPPSKLSLGGEGDVALGQARSAPFVIFSATGPPLIDIPVQYLTASMQIQPYTNHPWVRVVGSNANVDLTSNPQIVFGKQSQVLTVECIGSNVTLDNATGLNLMASAQFVMNSGAIITFIYTTGAVASGNYWQETSRRRY